MFAHSKERWGIWITQQPYVDIIQYITFLHEHRHDNAPHYVIEYMIYRPLCLFQQ